MPDLPPELNREIIIRLPAKPLLRFRCVCKEWRSIIDSPDFIKSHLDHQVGAEDLLMILAPDQLYCLSLESLTHSPRKLDPAIRYKSLDLFSLLFPGSSCRGLILGIEDDNPRVLTLYNPFSGHSLDFPHEEFIDVRNFGLGYDSSMDDYKVVISSRSDNRKTSKIYSFKSNKWHRIQDFPTCSNPVHMCGVCFDGALHWIAMVKERNIKCIIALDLNNETYRELPMPPLTPIESRCILYESAGCLLMSYYDNTRLDYSLDCIWILKNYVWTKLISFKEIADNLNDAVFVSYMKNKEQVLLQIRNQLLWFDLGTRTIVKEVSIGMLAKGIESCKVIPANLVQLNGSDKSS